MRNVRRCQSCFVVFPGSLCRDGYSLVLVRTVRVWWGASDLSAVRDNWDDNAAATTDNSVWCMDITTLINNDPTTSRPQDDHTHRRLLHADTGWPRHTSRADTVSRLSLSASRHDGPTRPTGQNTRLAETDAARSKLGITLSGSVRKLGTSAIHCWLWFISYCSYKLD